MDTYLVDGTPDFSGDNYFEVEDRDAGAMKPEQRKLHVVDSFSMSVTLCLSTLGFLRVYRQGRRSQRTKKGSLRTHYSARPNNLAAGHTSSGRPPACRGTVRMWSCASSKRSWQ